MLLVPKNRRLPSIISHHLLVSRRRRAHQPSQCRAERVASTEVSSFLLQKRFPLLSFFLNRQHQSLFLPQEPLILPLPKSSRHHHQHQQLHPQQLIPLLRVLQMQQEILQ